MYWGKYVKMRFWKQKGHCVQRDAILHQLLPKIFEMSSFLFFQKEKEWIYPTWVARLHLFNIASRSEVLGRWRTSLTPESLTEVISYQCLCSDLCWIIKTTIWYLHLRGWYPHKIFSLTPKPYMIPPANFRASPFFFLLISNNIS